MAGKGLAGSWKRTVDDDVGAAGTGQAPMARGRPSMAVVVESRRGGLWVHVDAAECKVLTPSGSLPMTGAVRRVRARRRVAEQTRAICFDLGCRRRSGQCRTRGAGRFLGKERTLPVAYGGPFSPGPTRVA